MAQTETTHKTTSEATTRSVGERRLVSWSSDEVGPKLLHLLGIPADGCRKAIIRLEARCDVIVTAEYFAGMNIDSDTGELETIVRKFELKECDNG